MLWQCADRSRGSYFILFVLVLLVSEKSVISLFDFFNGRGSHAPFLRGLTQLTRIKQVPQKAKRWKRYLFNLRKGFILLVLIKIYYSISKCFIRSKTLTRMIE